MYKYICIKQSTAIQMAVGESSSNSQRLSQQCVTKGYETVSVF